VCVCVCVCVCVLVCLSVAHKKTEKLQSKIVMDVCVCVGEYYNN